MASCFTRHAQSGRHSRLRRPTTAPVHNTPLAPGWCAGVAAVSPLAVNFARTRRLCSRASPARQSLPQGISSFLYNLYSYGQAECGDWAMWKCVFGHSKFLGCVGILAVRLPIQDRRYVIAAFSIVPGILGVHHISYEV